ncbi:odorant receptor 49a-like [Musca autumnalis]|uniref:odorant receptor 49a-like n=1 Tax=Musca autumnalis TaxID=221902 RepID=UPI003CF54951
MSERHRFEKVVQLPYVLLKSIGYDFFERPCSPWKKSLLILYFISSLICCAAFTYFAMGLAWAKIVSGAHDIPILLRLIDDVVYNIVSILKSFYFMRNIKSLKQIYHKFREMFPTTMEDRLAYRLNDYGWPKWVSIILYSQFISLSTIFIIPIVESFVRYAIALSKVGYASAEFSYLRLYEEKTYGIDHYNPLGYAVVQTLDFMNCHYCLIWMICPDLWLVAFAIQLCMHFDYISRTLESYEPSEKRSQEDSKVLAELIKKHQVVLDLADAVQENFSAIILVMVFSTASVLFGITELVLTQGVNAHVLGYLAFVPTGVAQYFMVCYYGQLIINKSLYISEAAYNQIWYNGSQSYKKSILTIIRRAQRHCEINAGGFQTTNLPAFEAVMRMTYQLFAIWSTMMEEK